MRAAAGAVDDAAIRGQTRRQHDAAGRDGGAAEDLAVDRIALGADAVSFAHICGDVLVAFGLA